MDSKKDTTQKQKLEHLVAGLADKPELTQRLLSIVKLADEPTQTGRIRSADEVECLLIEEVRKLGNETLASWAQGVDWKLGEELKGQEAGAQMREKKR
jgi:hypothetical protein